VLGELLIEDRDNIGKSGKTVLQNRYLIGAKYTFCSLGKSWRQDF